MNGIGVFEFIFQSSIIGSLLIVVIFLIRMIIKKKVNPTIIYYMWILVILKLIIPYGPESSFSIYNAFKFDRYYINENINNNEVADKTNSNRIKEFTDGNEVKENSYIGIDNNYSKENSLVIGEALKEKNEILIETNNKRNIDFKDILFITWLSGMSLLTIYIIIGYVNIRRITKKKISFNYEDLNNILSKCLNIIKIKNKVEIIITDKINTPSLCGVLKPKILIPTSILNKSSEEELKYIILHELCHFKRKDILLSWIICFLKVIYWFNPIVILGLNTMKEDCEISCDSMVLHYLGEEENIYYGNTIINVVKLMNKPSYLPGTTSIILSKKKLKGRIEMISKNKKFDLKNLIMGIIIIILLGSIGLTSSKGLSINGKEKETKSRQGEVSQKIDNVEKGFEDIENITIAYSDYKDGEDISKKTVIIDGAMQLKEISSVLDKKMDLLGYGMIGPKNQLIINKKDGTKEEYNIYVDETSIALSSELRRYRIADTDSVIELTKVLNNATGKNEKTDS